MEYFDHPNENVRTKSLQAALEILETRSIVFTVSDTHDVEGYAGSITQISILRRPVPCFWKVFVWHILILVA